LRVSHVIIGYGVKCHKVRGELVVDEGGEEINGNYDLIFTLKKIIKTYDMDPNEERKNMKFK